MQFRNPVSKKMHEVTALLNPTDDTPDVSIRIKGSDEFFSTMRENLISAGTATVSVEDDDELSEAWQEPDDETWLELNEDEELPSESWWLESANDIDLDRADDLRDYEKEFGALFGNL